MGGYLKRKGTPRLRIHPVAPKDGGDDLSGMRITLHSPLDCPGCGSRFEGAWVPGKETSGQACPSCGEVFTATWKGWTFLPEQATVTRDELSLSPPSTPVRVI